MTPEERDELYGKVATATTMLSTTAYASRCAFLSLIHDLPLDKGTEVDCDLEEARYRLRAAIIAEAERFTGMLDVVGD